MNLADSRNCGIFVTRLERCERAGKMNGRLTDWERNFIADLRDNFDSREDAEDMGMTPWNPSTNQWNTLFEIAEKV